MNMFCLYVTVYLCVINCDIQTAAFGYTFFFLYIYIFISIWFFASFCFWSTWHSVVQNLIAVHSIYSKPPLKPFLCLCGIFVSGHSDDVEDELWYHFMWGSLKEEIKKKNQNHCSLLPCVHTDLSLSHPKRWGSGLLNSTKKLAFYRLILH